MQFIRQNDTGKISIGPAISISDGYTVVTTLALSTADSARAKLGDDTTVDISGYTWAATTSMDGEYDLTLQTGVTDTCGPMTILIEDVSLCLPIRREFFIVEEAVYDLYFATDAGGPMKATMTALSQGKPSATPDFDEVLGRLHWQWTYAKVVTDTNTANQVQIFADDGSTILWEYNITDSSSVATRAESQSGA